MKSLVLLPGFLFAIASTADESIIDWLISTDRISPELTMTRDLAVRMDRTRLEGLTSQATGGLVMVLPTNHAWLQQQELYDKLMGDSPAIQKLRNDVVFAAGGEMDRVGGFDLLLSYANANDGVVDTAFGTPIKITADGTACIAEYDGDWNIVTTDCTNLRLPPLMFKDGSIYLTDKIILPETLWQEAAVVH